MTQHDLDFAVQMARDEAWISEDQNVFRAFLYHDPKGCFIAEKNGDPVGMCIATPYRHAGFFGELIVRPEHRGQGIGSRLLETAIDYLKKKNIRSIYLDAVPEAAPLYERYGFRKICTSFRFSGKLKGLEDKRVRAMRKWDLEPVCALDRTAFGEDRQFFLKWVSFMAPDFAKVLTKDEKIIGYITARYTEKGISIGPWIMPQDTENPEGLLCSLAASTFHETLNLGVLETSQKSIGLLKSLGFQEKKNSPLRMVWGKDSDLGTSSFCFAIGSPAKG